MIDSPDAIGQVKAALGVDLTPCLTSRSVTVMGEKTMVPLNP